MGYEWVVRADQVTWVSDGRSMTNETHVTIPIPAGAEVDGWVVFDSLRHDVIAGGTEGADDPTPETAKDPSAEAEGSITPWG